jgi:general stress protein 26
VSRAEDERDGGEVSRLLAGAARTVASARFCWLATTDENGRVNTRPMGRLLPDPDESDWTIRFVTDGRSRKASDIRRVGKVTVIFQRAVADAFVAMSGTAMLHEDESEVRRRWKNAYNAYFPSEQDRANAAFVEIDAERMECWIRGVTPEPFGLSATILERDASGDWQLILRDRNAV